IAILLAGMRMPAHMGTSYTTAFQRIFSDLAQTNQIALVPFLLEGVGGRPQLNQEDGIHPTAEGQKIVAENVWKKLEPLLKKMNPANDAKRAATGTAAVFSAAVSSPQRALAEINVSDEGESPFWSCLPPQRCGSRRKDRP